MKRAGLLLAAGVGTYLLILLANFPAGKVTGQLQKRFAPLTFEGVSGSVFSGLAARIVYDDLVAGPVHWRLYPSGLLAGRLEYRLEGNVMQQPFSGRVALGAGNRVRLHDLDATLDPAVLVEAWSPVGFTTTGELRLQLASLELQDGFPGELEGLLVWTGGAVTAPVSLVLGDVTVQLGRDADGINGQVSNDGDTRVSGSLALTPEPRYRIDLVLEPGRQASAEVVDFLRTWGQHGADGSYRLVDSGPL